MSKIKIEIAGGDTNQKITLSKRIDKIQEKVPLTGLRVLDCGCGAGGYVAEFLKLGSDAYGLEYSQEKLLRAVKNPLLTGKVFQGDIEYISHPNNVFDLALLNEVLEHIPNDMNGLREIYRILKPGGLLFIFSPNRLFPFEAHGVLNKLNNKVLPVYTPFIPYIPIAIGRRFFHYWARNYWPNELRTLVKRSGFEITQTGYLWQSFENISGQQPKLFSNAVPLLRKISFTLEKIPLIQAFGISQIIIARKPVSSPPNQL